MMEKSGKKKKREMLAEFTQEEMYHEKKGSMWGESEEKSNKMQMFHYKKKK